MPTYPVVDNIFGEIFLTIGIEVIRKYGAALLGSRYCERTYTCKNVRNHLFWLKQLHEPIMFRM